MPTLDNIEDYLASVEEYFYSSLSVVSHSIPDVHEVVNQLWVDIARYGPGMPAFPDVPRFPALGDFQVPPPPPPPLPSSAADAPWGDWAARHRWALGGVVVGVVGAGLLVGYRSAAVRGRTRHGYHAQKAEAERRQIVVVLGGDTPYGLPLIVELEKRGYIVIASVATPDAVEALEAQCQGFVKAHVLDPFQPAAIPVFLRSLSATLSRRFPINAPGDPFASPSSMPYIHSIVSLLTLSAPISTPSAPLEHVSLRDTYLPYLTATQITPLQVVQALLPLLRTGSARSRDKGPKSIVFCVPAATTRVGLPFAGVQSMSAAGTLRAAEVLRREIAVAARTQRSESMQGIRVVVADVGMVEGGAGVHSLPSEGVYKSMEDWSASEKVIYGPAFVAVMHERPAPATHWERVQAAFSGAGSTYGLPRKPTDMSVLVDSLVSVVNGGRGGPYLFGVPFGLGRIRNFIRGERFSIGAGAFTYKFASHLPSIILDGLINLPHLLISIRNRLLPIQPFRDPPADLPPPVTAKHAGGAPSAATESRRDESSSPESSEIETSSDADVESNAGDTVDSSWVSLNRKSESGNA